MVIDLREGTLEPAELVAVWHILLRGATTHAYEGGYDDIDCSVYVDDEQGPCDLPEDHVVHGWFEAEQKGEPLEDYCNPVIASDIWGYAQTEKLPISLMYIPGDGFVGLAQGVTPVKGRVREVVLARLLLAARGVGG